eukprot:3000207-Pleurochrysis_carterae.AAC.2
MAVVELMVQATLRHSSVFMSLGVTLAHRKIAYLSFLQDSQTVGFQRPKPYTSSMSATWPLTTI